MLVGSANYVLVVLALSYFDSLILLLPVPVCLYLLCRGQQADNAAGISFQNRCMTFCALSKDLPRSMARAKSERALA